MINMYVIKAVYISDTLMYIVYIVYMYTIHANVTELADILIL